jgi:hypothetical protein
LDNIPINRACRFGTCGIEPLWTSAGIASHLSFHRRAAAQALSPIAMTALASIGMLPLAFAVGSGSQMLQPLAIAVVGGMEYRYQRSFSLTGDSDCASLLRPVGGVTEKPFLSDGYQ